MSDNQPANRPTLYLLLRPTGLDCTLLLDGVDISRHVRGVEVLAQVGELTEVCLTLLANVEVLGEAGRLTFRKAGD